MHRLRNKADLRRLTFWETRAQATNAGSMQNINRDKILI